MSHYIKNNFFSSSCLRSNAAADLYRAGDLIHATAALRIGATHVTSLHAYTAGGGVPLPLRVRGIPRGASPDPLHAGRGAGGNEGVAVDGEGEEDLR